MHLIGQRLSGSELPFVLPPSLIPPSMRPRRASRQPARGSNTKHQEKTSDSPTSPQRRPPPPLPPKPVSPLVGAQRRRTISVAPRMSFLYSRWILEVNTTPQLEALSLPRLPPPHLNSIVLPRNNSSHPPIAYLLTDIAISSVKDRP